MDDLKKILSLSPVADTELTYTREDIYYTRYSGSSISDNIKKSIGHLKIRLIKDGKTGVFETNRLDDKGIKNAYNRAYRALELMRSDDNLIGLCSKQEYRTWGDYDEKTAVFSPVEKAEVLKKVFEKDNNAKVSGLFTNGSKYTAIANSKGVFAEHRSSFCSVSFTVNMAGFRSSWEAQSHKIDELNVEAVYERG